VAKHFAVALNKDTDPLHAKRKVLCRLAYARAKHGVDAACVKTFDVESVRATFLPVMETLFQLNGISPVIGSAAWHREMETHIEDVPFATLAAHPKLLKYHILTQINSADTDRRGCPWRREGEEVPDENYTTIPSAKRLPTHYRQVLYRSDVVWF
jgi:hypothetical protein